MKNLEIKIINENFKIVLPTRSRPIKFKPNPNDHQIQGSQYAFQYIEEAEINGKKNVRY